MAMKVATLAACLALLLTACAHRQSSPSAAAFATPKLEALSKRIAANPGDARAWNDRGHAYAMLGEAALARRDLEKSTQLRDDGGTHHRTGYSYFNLGDFTAALQHWQKAAELNEFQQYYDYYNLALGHWGVGDVRTAVGFYAKAVERNEAFARRDTLMDYIAGWTEKERFAILSLFDLWRRAYVETPPN
jgi:tetratricopeptide (TPR) repeat protein